ncbi:DUF2771 domain-containing protein [Streptomyces sp. NBC_01619]|uniref:DUF2771 domain-containing protein n=1 Tax=Streptomyces pratisoli TaxID=3139917 RepID=A0ACC6QIA3_9ACTN|nr:MULTISPECIES: DUF2771 domain-containing protein [unclassified Streptomyces]MCX4511616.1 DUF2771 domain-containing protein [Streptomyces sp. NBC_01619]
MTVAFLTGKHRRAAAALGAVSAGLLVLSACDKPTPLATVTVGTTSVHTEAACYNDGAAIRESLIQGCLNEKAEKSITVAADDKVRFGVDPEIAENGWTIFIGGQRAEQEPYHKTYRTIPASAFFTSPTTGEPSSSAQVSVVETTGKKLTGIWHFKLLKD